MKSYIKYALLALVAAGFELQAEEKNGSSCERAPVENYGQVFYDEILIDKPVKEVWPQILNYAKWQLGHLDAEHTTVKGDHGKVGEIVRIRKTHKDAQPYYAETVRLRLNRNVVWRIFGSPAPCTDAFGTKAFLDFRTEEVEGKTLFTASYYALWPIFGEDLRKQRETQLSGKEGFEAAREGGLAFKKYMESALPAGAGQLTQEQKK